MFEDLIVTLTLAEQKEPTSSIKHEVVTKVINCPKDWDDLMKQVKRELGFASVERSWPDNIFEPSEYERKVLDKGDVVIPPYAGTINIQINYSRKGWNC
jgi:hypothetical protein